MGSPGTVGLFYEMNPTAQVHPQAISKATSKTGFSGTGLAIFHDEICGQLPPVVATAIFTPDGALLWATEGTSVLSAPTDCAIPDHWRAVDDGHVQAGLAVTDKDRNVVGWLCVLLPEPSCQNVTDVRFLRSRLLSTIACIAQQIAINQGLSDLQRAEHSGGRSAVLSAIDTLADNVEQTDAAAGMLIQQVARILMCEVAAVDIPKDALELRQVTVSDRAEKIAIDKKLDGLLPATRTRCKIFVHDALAASDKAKNIARDEAIGALVLFADRDREPFNRDDISVARSAARKLARLVRGDTAEQPHALPRGLFMRRVDDALEREPQATHAVLYLNVDKMHVVNDTFGLGAGDALLENIGECLAREIGPNDLVTQPSGDRFFVFLSGCAEGRATKIAQNMRDSVAVLGATRDGRTVTTTLSIGIGMVPDVGRSCEEALTAAELACRAAKDHGRNRIEVYQDLDGTMMRRRGDINQIGFFQSALLEDRLQLFAQPIRPLSGTLKARKYEILVRMRDTEGQIISPDDFLPAAQRYQLMPAIDRWVLKATLEALGHHAGDLSRRLACFAVNLSGQSLADDEFLEFLESAIDSSSLSPDSLCFEITETSVVDNLDRVTGLISRVSERGCRFALDDFGTGYSSFAYLKELPVDFLKIDGVFVRDIMRNPLSEAIVSPNTWKTNSS
jgi:diguanylate cyclase (GGDEF)-like protein